MNPWWITVDNGEIFEGHQGVFADCFFTNATLYNIKEWCQDQKMDLKFREMTAEELEKHPRAITFREFLIEKYGEA